MYFFSPESRAVEYHKLWTWTTATFGPVEEETDADADGHVEPVDRSRALPAKLPVGKPGRAAGSAPARPSVDAA